MVDKHPWLAIAAHQRKYFNGLADVFAVPQPPDVMARLGHIVAAAELRHGEIVVDVGTGTGVLLPLIQQYQPSLIVACDLAEQMLAHVHKNFVSVLAVQCDVVQLPLKTATVDVLFMNAMYGNIADKASACSNVSRVLRRGGRLVVSHPEGRGFLEQLQATSDLFIESFPTREEFETLLTPFGLEVFRYEDRPKLYLMIARKR